MSLGAGAGGRADGGPRARRWLAVALACLAMLVLPIVGWLILPVRRVAPAAGGDRERCV